MCFEIQTPINTQVYIHIDPHCISTQIYNGGMDIFIYVFIYAYRQISNIRRTFLGNSIVDHSDVVGASPVGAAPTTSSFST